MADNQFHNIKKRLEENERQELMKYKKGDLSANINRNLVLHFIISCWIAQVHIQGFSEKPGM